MDFYKEVMKLKIIAITSPATDAGKTFIASGLAEAGTDRGLNTLFIDLDSPVGDAIRVFGTATNRTYPTVTSWAIFTDPWRNCLRSSRGTYVLPKPDRPDEEITHENIRRLLEAAEKFFDLVIFDLGTDFRTEHWSLLVKEANLSLLVSDCDEKALVRIQEFLSKSSAQPQNNWVLLVNNREEKSCFSPRQITRHLGESEVIGQIIEVPHYKNIQKGYPKTFSPDEVFARNLINQALGKQVPSQQAKIKNKGVNLGNQQLSPVNKSTKHIAKNTTSKKANLLILDNITSLTDYKGYIVDAVGEISCQIEASKPIWEADWRLGVNARPLRINGVYLFAQTDFLGPLDELDQIRFVEFVEMLLEKNKKVYVIDSGRWSEELLRMGAVIMEGGF